MRIAPGKNHFELFGLPVAFDLDTADLTTRYRELQKRVHPDKYANASDPERRLSQQMTSLVNEAFHILKDPVRRGRYLLGLRGVDMGEETDTKMDPAFLMEQMEWREQLESIHQSEHPQQSLDEMEDGIRQRMREKITEFRSALKTDSPDHNERARNLARELQFLEKIQREIEDVEDELN